MVVKKNLAEENAQQRVIQADHQVQLPKIQVLAASSLLSVEGGPF